MADSNPHSHDDPKSLIEKFCNTLGALDYDAFPEVLTQDVVHRNGLQTDNGLDAFIATLKGQLQMMPPMTMKHVIERVDITSDGIIYATGTSTLTFTSHPEDPVITPVLGVYTRAPQGQPDAGKINSLTIYEDHTPVIMKLKAILES